MHFSMTICQNRGFLEIFRHGNGIICRMKNKKIQMLLAEDRTERHNLIDSYIDKNTYAVTWVVKGRDAYVQLRDCDYDVGVIDIILADDMSGLEVIRKIHGLKPNLPLVAMTDEYSRKSLGDFFEAGADECLIEPFTKWDFVERIKKSLSRRNVRKEEGVLAWHGLELDRRNFLFRYNGKEVELKDKEYLFLKELVLNQGGPVDFYDLQKALWGNAKEDCGRLFQVVRRLRKKLVDCGLGENAIDTYRRRGYALTF